ncbi:hypothetical protein TorRG33x02_001900 [Trema orientale]|uniref:Uncharacterized protein n=1 Tax=Trema orientale TaxID=63057 RepID=A0A2P5G1I0_TREOI|nr:hypothetical protein TorRG33x02_001900 [Trema orientale]
MHATSARKSRRLSRHYTLLFSDPCLSAALLGTVLLGRACSPHACVLAPNTCSHLHVHAPACGARVPTVHARCPRLCISVPSASVVPHNTLSAQVAPCASATFHSTLGRVCLVPHLHTYMCVGFPPHTCPTCHAS